VSAAPEVVSHLMTEAGEPFGALLSGGVVVTRDGAMLVPSNLLAAPQAPALAPDPLSGFELLEPAAPAFTDADLLEDEDDDAPAPQPVARKLTVPDVTLLHSRWDGKNDLDVLDGANDDRVIASVRRKGKNGTVTLHLYIVSGEPYHTELKIGVGRYRWATEEEICRAYGGDAATHAAVAKLLLTIADLWLEGPQGIGYLT